MKIRDYATARVRYVGIEESMCSYSVKDSRLIASESIGSINSTLVDVFTHECLITHVGEALERAGAHRHTPSAIRVDNGPEFIAKELDLWVSQYGITLAFSRPRKPTDTAPIESFNSSFQEECLQTHRFLSLKGARLKIETRRKDYNEFRPHSSQEARQQGLYSCYTLLLFPIDLLMIP